MRAWIVVLLAGCMESRTDELVCNITDDCDTGRVCDRGYCVLAGDAEDPPEPANPLAPPAGVDCHTWDAHHFDPCTLPGGTALALTEPGLYLYDTAQARLFRDDVEIPTSFKTTDAGRVLVVDSLTIGSASTLRVIGNVPLVIASWSSIEVAGRIDASSTSVPASLGAGANSAACIAATKGGNDDHGAAGGGGGGFGGAGGNGGDGDTADGGLGGAALAVPLLAGGCPGARGGRGGPDGGLGGTGGAGGGAIQLSARLSIDITGGITAGGAGGGGGLDNGGADSDAGGGGGGSGGMIGLESPTVAVAAGATLAANGGGGGQGSNLMLGGRGTDGLLSANPALGGTGGDGDPGGLGSDALALAGTRGDQDGDNGAGGGGGGAGIIVIASTSATIQGVVSPPAR